MKGAPSETCFGFVADQTTTGLSVWNTERHRHPLTWYSFSSGIKNKRASEAVKFNGAGSVIFSRFMVELNLPAGEL